MQESASHSLRELMAATHTTIILMIIAMGTSMTMVILMATDTAALCDTQSQMNTQCQMIPP